MTSKDYFLELIEQFTDAQKDTLKGKMMSSDGISLNKKFFAFYWKKAMVFKLGKGFDMDSYNVEWTYLNPFKSKGVMRAWYVISDNYVDIWPELLNRAYLTMKEA